VRSGRPVATAQIRLVGLEVGGRLRLDELAFVLREHHAQVAGHALGDLELHVENVVDDPVVGLCPKMGVIRDSNQLRRDPDPAFPTFAARPADGAFEYISDIEFTSDLRDRLFCIRILSRAGSGDHPQSLDGRQARGDLLGHAVGEVVVVGRTEVFEGQDDDAGRRALGGFVGCPFEQAFGREDEEEGDHCGDHHRERVRPPPADQRPLLGRRSRGGGLNCAKRQGQIVRR